MKKPQQQPNMPQTAEEYYRRAGQHRTAVRRLWGDFVVSFFFAAAALIVLVFFTIAWFVSNDRVEAGVAAVSAANGVDFLLASTGGRQEVEMEKWKPLSAGTGKEDYTQYYEQGQDGLRNFASGTTLYCGTSGLAWYLDGQQWLSPGKGDAMELYFIPQKDGLQQIRFTMTAEGYRDPDTENSDLVPITDSNVQALLNTHILFFRQIDDDGFYTGLLGMQEAAGGSTAAYDPSGGRAITINASDYTEANGEPLAKFAKDTPYKVTIYWKWPKLFHNYLYNSKYYDDLFASETSWDQAALINYINSDQERIFGTNNAVKGENGQQITIEPGMPQQDFEKCASAYDAADETIGSTVKYIFVKVEADTDDP